MKKLTSLLIVLFSIAINTSILAHEGNYPSEEKIFFYDPEAKMVFIDFNVLAEAPAYMKIIGADGSAVIYTTIDLSNQTMFELDLQKFDEGHYTIAIEQNNRPILKQSFFVEKDTLGLSSSTEK